MATVILVRHGRSTANATGTLAGRLPDVHLDEAGLAQAAAVGERLASVRLSGVVTSPMARCRETALEITRRQEPSVPAVTDDQANECDYGTWQGRALKDLAQEALWKTVQTQPSAVTFPEGESMRDMQARALAFVRHHDQRISREHGEKAVWVLVSHGDVIKSILADALGMHLDLFQRIHVDPASASIIRFADARPFVLGTNTLGGDLSWLTPIDGSTEQESADAPVGGGAGPDPLTGRS